MERLMEQNNLLPIFFKVKNEPCLVVGGGKVAYQKIKQLIASEAKVTVLSIECIDKILKLKKVIWIQSKYHKKYINSYKLEFCYLIFMKFHKLMPS